MPLARRRLRILTWQVHGNYMYYLSQVPHEFHLVTDALRSPQHGGRCGRLPWGDNVHEVRAEAVRRGEFDLVLYQSAEAWLDERHRLLSPAQQRLPIVYLEHDPPRQHPTDTRHCVDQADALLVHVTPFNALMWDSGATPVRVVEHGVRLMAPAAYRGELARGVVAVNDLDLRGRRLGLDLYEQAAREVPLTLVGLGAQRLRRRGGQGEVDHRRLPEFMAMHRFFFHPARYTSLGLAVIEAMMVGLPIVGCATTELATVVHNDESGFIDTRPERLLQGMRLLLRDPAEAKRLGRGARAAAMERFGIGRFVDDWLDVFRTVAG